MKFLDRATFRYGLMLGADLSTKVTGLVMQRVIVEHWQAAGYGKYGAALQVATYGMLIVTRGPDAYACKLASKDRSIIGRLASTLMLMRLGLAVPVFVGVLAVAWAIPAMRPDLPLVALLGLTLFTSATMLTWVPQAILHAPAMAVVSAAVPTLNLVTVIVAALLAHGLWALGAAKLAAELLVTAGLLYWVMRHVTRLGRPLPLEQWKRIIRDAAPLGTAALLRNLGLALDAVLLLAFAGSSWMPVTLTENDVGYYRGALAVYLLAVSAGGAYFGLLYPRMAALGDDLAGLRRETNAALWRVLMWSLAGLIVGTIFAKLMLTLLLGAKFAAGARALQILLWSALGFHLGSTYNWLLVVRHRQQLAMWITAASTLVHIAAKLTLIPLLGIEGAAVGMLLGEGVYTVLGWMAAREHLGQRRALVEVPARAE